MVAKLSPHKVDFIPQARHPGKATRTRDISFGDHSRVQAKGCTGQPFSLPKKGRPYSNRIAVFLTFDYAWAHFFVRLPRRLLSLSSRLRSPARYHHRHVASLGWSWPRISLPEQDHAINPACAPETPPLFSHKPLDT